MLARLHAQIAAVCPIDGVAYTNGVDHLAGVRVDYQPTATAQQQADAQAIVAGFDWSEAAHTAWLDAQEPDLKDIKDQAVSAIQTNTTYLALGNPTNAQNLAQIRALTNQNTRMIRALLRTIQRTWR